MTIELTGAEREALLHGWGNFMGDYLATVRAVIEIRLAAVEQERDERTEERDYWHAVADAHRQRLRGTVTLRGQEPNYWAEWHRTHCAAAQAAAEVTADRDFERRRCAHLAKTADDYARERDALRTQVAAVEALAVEALAQAADRYEQAERADVRCPCCGLRFGEREDYSCEPTGTPHSYDQEELDEAGRSGREVDPAYVSVSVGDLRAAVSEPSLNVTEDATGEDQ